MALIVIDPGHGGIDPGTVGPSIPEKTAALETALTYKHVFHTAGFDVLMTRYDDSRPSYEARVTIPEESLAYISIHYNMPRSYGLVYYETRDPGSRALAEHLAREAQLSRVWPSQQSNHAGLYIDRVGPAAVMHEVAAIDVYPNDADQARQFRLNAAQAALRAVLIWDWERRKA